MKLDKETVIKHQFWFLLGGYLLIWLVAVLWLKFTAPDTISAKKKDYETAKKDLEAAQKTSVNKATFLPPWEKATGEFEGHKNKIWEKAWKYQEGMYDWPSEWTSKYNMTDPKTAITIDDLARFRQKLYPDEIKNLRENAPHWIEPVELLGGFDNVFKPRTKEEWHEIPTREECWLAQEDIWVKREVFVVVYDAMGWQAFMEPRPIDEKKEPNPDPKNIKHRYRFVNKNWEVTLHIRPSADNRFLIIGGDSTIKNIHPSGHPQALTSAKGRGIWFNVTQNGVRAMFEVRGEPVNSGETRPFKMEKDLERGDYPPLDGIAWDKVQQNPIIVSQGFDQSNCPIRRINAIELGQQDCRTFTWSLQPNHPLAALDGAAPDPNQAAGGGAGAGNSAAGGGGGDAQAGMAAQMGQMQKSMMAGMGGRMGGGASAAGNPTTNNAFERNRYLQSASIDKSVNPPSRHLPLAIQVIVEQAHMHDFLLALANSRLRFQITQAEFHHEPNYVPQSDDDKKGENKATTGAAGFFMGAMPGMGGGGMQTRMMRAMNAQQQQMGAGMGGNPRGNMMQMLQQSQGDMMARMKGGMMGGAGGAGSMMMRPPMMGGVGGAAGAGRGMSMAMAPGGMKGGLLPAGTGAGTADPKQNAQNQQDDNVVELTVYGIATLYRSPDQPKSDQQSGQTGTPTADSTQQPQGATPPNSATPPDANASGQPKAPPQPGATGGQPGAPPPPPGAPAPANNNGAAKPADGKQAEKPAEKQPTPPPPPPAGEKK
jgi:hypothetical protein